jgi:hypothetical protein
MKTLKNASLLLCLIMVMLSSCGRKAADKIAKSWLVTDIKTGSALPESLKTKMLAGSEMVFTADGRYNTTGGIGVDQGKYTLDKDEKTLSTISSAGKQNAVYTIDKLSNDELVLKNSSNTVTCKSLK